MHIDWQALGTVAAVSVAASVLFVTLLAFGVRFISAARIDANQGRNVTSPLGAGYACLGLGALLVLFCLYLIVPQFH